jgi:hypothetical protein
VATINAVLATNRLSQEVPMTEPRTERPQHQNCTCVTTLFWADKLSVLLADTKGTR